ncbi:MAG: DUF503 domain-containing protein [Gammaproteobacteria bacterium]|nr:DUF503 domain-containing protein [Gammaproteobacteria bacterium]
MKQPAVHILYAELTLQLPAAHSLKDKRRVLASLKDRVANHYNVSLAEIASHDDWQQAVLGLVMINNSRPHLSQVLEALHGQLQALGDIRVLSLTQQWL